MTVRKAEGTGGWETVPAEGCEGWTHRGGLPGVMAGRRPEQEGSGGETPTLSPLPPDSFQMAQGGWCRQ